MKCKPSRLLGLLLFMSTASAGSLIFNTEEYPPFNFTDADGNIDGVSTQVVREIIERSGLDVEIRLLPWTRAYTEALHQTDTCVFSTTHTEARDPLFQWVGPLVENDWVIFTLPDSPVVVDTLDDLHELRVGGYRDDAISIHLQALGIAVDDAPNDRLNARKLAAGRIDVWASGRYLAPYYAQLENIGPLEARLAFHSTHLSLACNLAIPESTINAIQAALDELKTEGVYRRIMAQLP